MLALPFDHLLLTSIWPTSPYTMSLLRIAAPLRKPAVASFRPIAMSARGYADKPDGEFSEQYQRGSPQGFAKKEQAQENQYMQQQEKEKLKNLRDKLAAQRKHLDDVETAINDLDKK